MHGLQALKRLNDKHADAQLNTRLRRFEREISLEDLSRDEIATLLLKRLLLWWILFRPMSRREWLRIIENKLDVAEELSGKLARHQISKALEHIRAARAKDSFQHAEWAARNLRELHAHQAAG